MSLDFAPSGLISGTSYQLTNAFLGPYVFLHYEQANNSVYGSTDAPRLNLTVNLTGDTNTGDDYNPFTLCTGSSAMQRCLGVNPVTGPLVTLYYRSADGISTPPYLRWTSRRTSQDNFLLRLQNDRMGEGWYLDTYSDTLRTYMGQGNLTGQYWSLTPVEASPEEGHATSTIIEDTITSSGALDSRTTAMSTTTHPADAATSTSSEALTSKTGLGTTSATSAQATPTAIASSGTRLRSYRLLAIIGSLPAAALSWTWR